MVDPFNKSNKKTTDYKRKSSLGGAPSLKNLNTVRTQNSQGCKNAELVDKEDQ